jgi:hypothetical protein
MDYHIHRSKKHSTHLSCVSNSVQGLVLVCKYTGEGKQIERRAKELTSQVYHRRQVQVAGAALTTSIVSYGIKVKSSQAHRVKSYHIITYLSTISIHLPHHLLDSYISFNQPAINRTLPQATNRPTHSHTLYTPQHS